ncbi:MAG TPA: PQQ-binding-like beta-propeller repeat protein [Candidatus Dormibacteraeota bacterium]|nr:PQQ-binding-like beta-propeller repeat protein [Candidatus Dormibacteraeota bacterium]
MRRPTPRWGVSLLSLALVLVTACGGQRSPAISSAAQPRPCTTSTSTLAPANDDWTTYHRSGDRDGVDVGSPPAGRLVQRWQVALDGAVYAQPLVYRGLVVSATEHNTVYALEAATGCLVWKKSLGPSFDASRLQCGNIPELGVTSTPVIDPSNGTLFVVSYQPPGRFQMVALNVANGAIRWRYPIDLPGSDPLYQLNRPALALDAGRVDVAFGGRAGDCGNYHGFVVGVPESGSGPQVLFQASPQRGGAIWAPSGPVVLPNGDLLVTTSNTDERSSFDGSDAVVRLSPSLQRLDLFAPSNWVQLNDLDLDLGSVNPTLVGDDRVFQVGKEGIGYLLDLNHLGGVGGQLFSASLGGCYAIGATAYRAPYVYVPCDHGVKAVEIQGSSFRVAWQGPNFRAGSPIVAGGLVWDIDFDGGRLWALNAKTGAVEHQVKIGTAEHFVAPSASAGRLYLPVGSRLMAFSFAS